MKKIIHPEFPDSPKWGNSWFQKKLKLAGFRGTRNFYLQISEEEEIQGICYSISVFHQSFFIFFNSDGSLSLINAPYEERQPFFFCENVESVHGALRVLINWGFSDFNQLI